MSQTFKTAKAASTAIGLVLGAGLLTAPAYAQPGDAGGESQAESGRSIETIVVTARRREEQAQQAPVAVTAMSGDFLEKQNVNRFEDLSYFAPNTELTYSAGSGVGAHAFIRGVGAQSTALYADPPVAIYIDNILVAHGAGLSFDLLNIDRVEVLRGPQGTLFGRNTTGGAINIHTRTPADVAGGRLSASYGSNDEVSLRMMLDSGEIANTGFRALLTAGHRHNDGWIDSPTRSSNRDPGFYVNTGGMFVLDGSLTDSINVTYRADYSHTERLTAFQVVAASDNVIDYFSQSPSFGGQPFLWGMEPLETFYTDDRLPDQKSETIGNSLTVDVDFGEHFSLRSITSYRRLNQMLSSQIGGSGGLLGPVSNPRDASEPIEIVNPFINVGQPARAHQYTQEFQLSGDFDRVDFVAGMFLYREHLREFLPADITFVGNPTTGFQVRRTRDYANDTYSYAGFGQVSYTPPIAGDRLEISIGGRYTKDERSLSEFLTSNTAPDAQQKLRNEWDNIGWSAAVSYQWADDVMTYARASSAYKAGGYNPGALAPAYDPEEATSFEVGMKMDLFDRNVRLNLAAFHTDYSNLQISQFDASNGASNIENAGEATYTGAELELTALLGEHFQFDATVGYVDAKFQEYLNLDGAGNPVNVADQARVPFVAPWNYNVAMTYSTYVSGLGDLSARVSYAYRDKRYFYSLDSLNPFNEEISSGQLNDLRAQITIADLPFRGDNVRYSFQIYGANLLDQDYVVQGIDFGTANLGVVSYARPRTFGAKLTAEF